MHLEAPGVWGPGRGSGCTHLAFLHHSEGGWGRLWTTNASYFATAFEQRLLSSRVVSLLTEKCYLKRLLHVVVELDTTSTVRSCV